MTSNKPRKLRIQWSMDLEYEIKMLCDPKSPQYEKETAEKLEQEYQKFMDRYEVMNCYGRVRLDLLESNSIEDNVSPNLMPQ